MKLVDSNVLIYAARPDADELRRSIPWDEVAVPLVTHNVSDFAGIADLRVEDPLPGP